MQEQQPDMGHQPSFAELAAALAAIRQPTPENSLMKWVTTAVGAAAIGIGAWTLNSINTMQQTLTRVDTTVTAVQTTTTDMVRRVDAVVEKQSDLNAKQSAMEQRIGALERARQ